MRGLNVYLNVASQHSIFNADLTVLKVRTTVVIVLAITNDLQGSAISKTELALVKLASQPDVM